MLLLKVCIFRVELVIDRGMEPQRIMGAPGLDPQRETEAPCHEVGTPCWGSQLTACGDRKDTEC